MGKCPVRLRALRSSELREVGATPVPGRLEWDVGGQGSLEAGRLGTDLRRIESRLRCAVYRSRRRRGRRKRSLRAIEHLLGSRISRSREGLEGAFLAVLEERILVDWLFHDRRVRRCDGLVRTLGKPGLALHSLDQLWESDPSLRVEVENPPQDGIALIGDGQNGLEKVGILAVSLVGGVLNRSTLPRVAATSQVDKDHTKGPHVVGRRLVAGQRVRVRILTF